MFSKSLLLVLFAINTSLDMKKCRGGGGGGVTVSGAEAALHSYRQTGKRTKRLR